MIELNIAHHLLAEIFILFTDLEQLNFIYLYFPLDDLIKSNLSILYPYMKNFFYVFKLKLKISNRFVITKKTNFIFKTLIRVFIKIKFSIRFLKKTYWKTFRNNLML